MIPYILTDNSLTVVIDGKAHTMANTHPSFLLAQEALKSEDYDRLQNLFDVSKAVGEYLDEAAGIEVKVHPQPCGWQDSGLHAKESAVSASSQVPWQADEQSIASRRGWTLQVLGA